MKKLLTLCMVATLLMAGSAFAADKPLEAAPNLSFVFPEQRVVVANPRLSFWKTDMNLDGHYYLSSTVPTTNCCYPGTVTVPPYGAKIVRDISDELVSNTAFFLFNIGNVPATATTTQRFTAPNGSTMTLTIPSFYGDGIKQASDVWRGAGAISNIAGRDETNVLLFNADYEHRANLTIHVYDGDGNEIGREPLDLEPGGWLFYPLKTQVAEGTLRIAPGYQIIVSPMPVTQLGNVYPVAFSGPNTGASAPRVISFAPVVTVTFPIP
jgi:hypothetical protein